MDGILLVDKPAGISSFGVVARVRGIIKAQTGHKIKIGHTGTLDPGATGLLILVLGKYTKRASEFSKLDKVYKVSATLGLISTTGDAEGVITPVNSDKPKLEELTNILANFVGDIMQTPPAFSAIKIEGQRAYKLAREGKDVVLEPRKVKILSIDSVTYSYPGLSFRTNVSSGTYIRSLVEDIGEKAGTGAYMSELRRESVGEFSVDDAIGINGLDFQTIEQRLSNR